MTKVLVTGMGIVTAIGDNLIENHTSLKTARSGLSRADHLQSNYKDQFYFGEIKKTNQELLNELNKSESEGLSRTDLLAFKAFKEAIEDAGLSKEQLSNFKTGFVSASTVGGMSEMDVLAEDAKDNDHKSQFLESHSCYTHLLRLVKEYKIKGLTDVINTACSSSANAIMIGAKWIKAGLADRVIVGGVDALSKFTVNGFNSLQILSPERCKPFDQNRQGLNLGEGAAYLVLEKEELAGSKKIYGNVTGYGNSNDAFHPSTLSEEAVGVKMAMQKALRSAGIQADQVSYINAHGTSTLNNDEVELRGITEIFGSEIEYASTKSFTGHTLAAAGSVEAVYSLLGISNNERYPSLNFDQNIEGRHAPLTSFKTDASVDHVLSNSFGFAGNCSSVLFSKYSS